MEKWLMVDPICVPRVNPNISHRFSDTQITDLTLPMAKPLSKMDTIKFKRTAVAPRENGCPGKSGDGVSSTTANVLYMFIYLFIYMYIYIYDKSYLFAC